MIEATLAVSIAVNYDDRFSGRPLARIGGREIRPSRTLLRRGLGEIIDHVLAFHTTAVVVMATPWARNIMRETCCPLTRAARTAAPLPIYSY